MDSGLTDKVSNRTVRRCLNANGYGYRRSRKKGLLVKKDLSKRVAFARKVRKLLPEDFWKTGILFYLDAAGFTYKKIHSMKQLLQRRENGVVQMKD